MGVRLIQVPYDSGLREKRMGRGPRCFVEHGDGYPMEMALTFDLYRSVAAQVSTAHDEKLPVLGATVTAYDPETDRESKGLAVGLELIVALGKLGKDK